MNEAGVLLDTSVVIDFLRQKDKKSTWFYFLAKTENKLAISILTHTELYSGKQIWKNLKARNELKDLLSNMGILSLNQSTSELGGKFRSKIQIDLADAVIAATAIENKLPLATFNRKHFGKIAGLRLVKNVLVYKN